MTTVHARGKASLDIFWLKDESLESSENLPDPDIIAQEIVDDLEASLEQFRLIANVQRGRLHEDQTECGEGFSMSEVKP